MNTNTLPIDELLTAFREAYKRLARYKESYSEFANITFCYETLRNSLMTTECTFEQTYTRLLGNNPDTMATLMEAVFEEVDVEDYFGMIEKLSIEAHA